MKRMVNPTVEPDNISAFAKMIMEELKCLSPRQQVYTKKLLYDTLHLGILKMYEDDEKHVSENLDSIVKDDKTHKTDMNENIISVISMVLGRDLRSKAFDLIQLLINEKCISFNENYTITHLKTDMTIPIQEFLRLIFVVNSNVKEYEVFFQMIINDIPIEVIRNRKLIKFKEIQVIANSISGTPSNDKPFKWISFK